jgi:glutaredoxin-like YruB-family protein
MAKIKVYSTPVCPYCVTVKSFLQDKGLEFEEINVAENEAARNEMVEKTGQMGVPVVEIDGQMIIGFDKAKITELLGIKE